MDGNGRWAQQQGKERIFGHVNAIESVREAVKGAIERGVEYLTLYVFSTENLGRPREEVEGLMELFCKCVDSETEELVKQGVKVDIIGDRSKLSEAVLGSLKDLETETCEGDKMTLILALNYSSHWEITEAVKKITGSGIKSKDITTEKISEALLTSAYPDPDLIIRTGGEQRLSNFLLWQAAYSELYFTDILWPDFDRNEFSKAIDHYSGRERRFGLVKQ
jgi:undecaprenyl diphosphate synthase